MPYATEPVFSTLDRVGMGLALTNEFHYACEWWTPFADQYAAAHGFINGVGCADFSLAYREDMQIYRMSYKGRVERRIAAHNGRISRDTLYTLRAGLIDNEQRLPATVERLRPEDLAPLVRAFNTAAYFGGGTWKRFKGYPFGMENIHGLYTVHRGDLLAFYVNVRTSWATTVVNGKNVKSRMVEGLAGSALVNFLCEALLDAFNPAYRTSADVALMVEKVVAPPVRHSLLRTRKIL